MLPQDLAKSATRSLIRNKSRSLLTILGIVIGIAAVIMMLSLGQGAQQLILSQVADLGSDQIFVESGAGDTEGGPPSPFIEQSITLEDAAAMRKYGPFSTVGAILLSNTTVTTGEESLFTDIAGVDQYQLEISPAEVTSGRYIDGTDVESYAKVAVLGSEIATDLFGDGEPVGQSITVKNITFRIIGVLEPQGSQFFSNLDVRVSIPVTTMQRDISGTDNVSFISARATGDVEFAKEEVRWILRDTHNIDNPEGDEGKDDFLVSSQEDAVAIIGVVGGALTMLLASIAAISLVVGGIGIMNIMLVSVTERTREIGLRKAIGATEKEILQQFLVESVLLTLLGGLIGILLGVGLSVVIALGIATQVEGWVVVVPPMAIVLGFAVSTVVGLVFGIYPARRAAKLDPIEALRYE